MSKNEDLPKQIDEPNKFNQIGKGSNIILSAIMIIICIIIMIPIGFIVVISFTDQTYINQYGYRLLPHAFSLDAYKYIFTNGTDVLRAFCVSIFITVVGTILGTFLTSSYAYVISRRDFAYRKFFNAVAILPMLITGGMVAYYLVVVQFLHLKDTLWALILPLAMSSFLVFILRTFYQSFVPESLIEAARIDGASEIKTFTRIVMPIAKPGIATIALFLTLTYWNDWFNAMLFIDDPHKVPIQYYLVQIENSVSFLQQMSGSMGSLANSATAALPEDTAKMAIVVIILIPVVIVYPFFQRYFVGGITIGSVKE